MARKSKVLYGGYNIKVSGWSVTSIWWGLIVFGIVPLGALAMTLSGAFDLAEALAGVTGMQYAVLKLVCCLAFILIPLVSFVIVSGRITSAKMVSYEYRDNMLIQKRRRLLHFGEEEICRTIYTLGATVSVRQTLKGVLFNYGDVILSIGVGNVSEVILENVKKPYKAKRRIEEGNYMPYWW